MSISKYDPGKELSSLDFGSLIGGPLSAVVDAQIRAAESTVSYIKDVGFDENGDPNYVSFTYPKEVAPYEPGTTSNLKINVDDAGNNYNVIPYVEIIGDGFGATAEAVVSDKKVKSIVVTNQGQNYSSILDVVVLTPGRKNAAFSISELSPNGTIIAINVDNAGENYTHPPILSVDTSQNGKGADLQAVIDENGQVIDVNVINGGVNYTTTDNINNEDPEGQDAEASVIFSSGTPSVAAKFMDMKLDVPLLTLVPIPYVRIEETTIDFNAKINSVEKINSSQSIGANANLSIDSSKKFSGQTNVSSTKKSGFFRRKSSTTTTTTNFSGNRRTQFNVSASYKRTNSSNTEIAKTYTMGIQVRAKQEEIPAGMEKVLGILENSMVAQPL